MSKKWTAWTAGEAKTGIGNLVSFECEFEKIDTIKTFIEENIRSIEVPIIRSVDVVGHGGFGCCTRYKIKQHKYAGGGNGYIEVLEILNPPENRCPFIIHEYNGYKGSCFSEWDSVKSAVKAFDGNWGSHNWHEGIEEISGFKRLVEIGPSTAWFYAIGEEVLHGDYTLSSGLEDDPVFRLGRKFVVTDDEGISKIKTCMGCRFVTEEHEHYSSQSSTNNVRVVYFDDGSTLRVYGDNSVDGHDGRVGDNGSIRLLREDEIWITDAMEKFHAFLSGKKEGFQLKFAGGQTFTAKLSKKGKSVPSVEGDYFLKVTYANSTTKEGWIRNFVPTPKHPDIVSYVKAKHDSSIQKVKIIKCVPKHDGKKWAGTFYVPKS